MRPVCVRGMLLGAIVLTVATSCSGLLTVDTPGVISGDRLDPIRDAHVLSLSARQNFATAYGAHVLYGAWFTGEAISAETDPAVFEFERREVTGENPNLLSLWTSLSMARETAERVVRGLEGTAGASANTDLARAALFAGFSYLVMSEYYCAGASDGGPLLTEAEMLQRATGYFVQAHAVADAAARTDASTTTGEATAIAFAALVGSARARLAAGDRARAAADAARVPPDFVMTLWYADDLADLARLGNTLWFHTALRATLSIAQSFRNLDDPRVPVAPPSSSYPPFDGVTPFWTQRKYASYDAPIRLASGLEAEYVAAEASGPSAMLELIRSRRAANGLASWSGAADSASIVGEFMEQRSRDFFLEGKRVGDARRQRGSVAGLPQPGGAFHKPGFPPISDETCWPLPDQEMSR